MFQYFGRGDLLISNETYVALKKLRLASVFIPNYFCFSKVASHVGGKFKDVEMFDVSFSIDR